MNGSKSEINDTPSLQRRLRTRSKLVGCGAYYCYYYHFNYCIMIPFITGLIASAIAQVTYCYLKDKKLKSLPKDKQKDWVEDENRNCFI